ncbi:hypothetical protein ERO13_A01G134700v2 [Gossypium hirsutum]|uniref:Uncharacterized protein n=1 Tax=Gossypium barbadense TaxID=3634 RepID=A0A5J5WW64_GOSBA|nr:hypothetical protein ES319_A01G138400v1 [Gossypium barbadense]KAG4214670.1 hypothetical protein ERO13_A01G134700v2 [Gossypium hirsutum]
MAKVCFSKDILIMFMAVVLSVATIVSAQDSAMAPAPSMDTGSAFSMPVTGVTVTLSLIISLLALLKSVSYII